MQPEEIAALIDEATKEVRPRWVRRRARSSAGTAVWHSGRTDRHMCSPAGRAATPELGERAYVRFASKDKGSRLVTWVAAVQRRRGGSESWDRGRPEPAHQTTQLAGQRGSRAAMARDCVLYRLTPTATSRDADAPTEHSHAQPPVESPARTRVPRPWHLRGDRRRAARNDPHMTDGCALDVFSWARRESATSLGRLIGRPSE